MGDDRQISAKSQHNFHFLHVKAFNKKVSRCCDSATCESLDAILMTEFDGLLTRVLALLVAIGALTAHT